VPTAPDALAVGAAGERLRMLRRERPSASLGLLVSAPAPAEDQVARLIQSVTALAASVALDVVAVGPGTSLPAADRTARSALTERLTARGLHTAYVCRPADLDHGWTHVRSGRAAEVWTTRE
jgi:anthraniloyl-CoA monooxygenase